MNPETLKLAPLSDIAFVVKADWKRPYFGAVPYLDAMFSLSSVSDSFGYDTGESVVLYFLANANTWRGPVAKAVKAELKRRLKALHPCCH
jgi:hypothetical protein